MLISAQDIRLHFSHSFQIKVLARYVRLHHIGVAGNIINMFGYELIASHWIMAYIESTRVALISPKSSFINESYFRKVTVIFNVRYFGEMSIKVDALSMGICHLF